MYILDHKTHFGKFRRKIEILSTHNQLCPKFAVICGKMQLLAPPTFLAHDAAVCDSRVE